MELSIIIVNYNVKHFIEQCLHSVLKAAKNIDHEVFVVDNNSVDGSTILIKEKFPTIKLIENKENVGFSKANNQAIKQASGKYILLLNPDTMVEEDTFIKCIHFMKETKDAGCVGVKMIDGKGDFLPESKRSLPTPFVAFSKIFGLSKLLPKSKIFGKYHLGYLDKNQNHPVDIISGAFMLIRKEALKKTGLLDEDFFMYGEDIDISFRLKREGYQNYYLADTTIIHYKGESTKKSSVNYVFIFYNAMIIFAKKHFSRKNAKLFSFFINLAIYFRASLSILKRFVSHIFLPALDVIFLYLGFFLISLLWAQHKFPDGGNYPKQFLLIIVPTYIIIWLISLYMTGGYEKPVRLFNTIKGSLVGTFFILVLYALLPESLRYSRAITLFGAGWSLMVLPLIRIGLHVSGGKQYQFYGSLKKSIVIVGQVEEAKRVLSLIKQTNINHEFIGFVSANESDYSKEYIGTINQLIDIIEINKIDEVIFCSKDIAAQNIIKLMLKLSKSNVEYKIAPPKSVSVIGSSSIHTAGELYVVNFDAITKPLNIRSKRFFNAASSLVLLILSPVMLLFMKRPLGFPLNCLKVLIGTRSWVSFYIHNNLPSPELPKQKKGVLSPMDIFSRDGASKEIIDRANINYARNYTISSDIEIMLKGFRNLGRKN